MSLYFLYGTMNSGKTTRLLQEAYNYKNRGFNCILIQSELNDRDDGVQSRIGLKSSAHLSFNAETDLKKSINDFIEDNDENYKLILVDEAQFLTKKQVDDLFLLTVEKNLIIECYGLKNDFRGEAFSGSKRLLELAELEQLDTVPCRCGEKARFNARFSKKTGKILTSGSEISIEGEEKDYFYDPVCSKCFINLGGKLK